MAERKSLCWDVTVTFPTGRVVRWQSISPGRCSSRVSSYWQRGQVCWSWRQLHLWANWCWNLGWSWKKDLNHYWRDQRDQLFLSEDFCFSAVFQCCSVARQFTVCWLHGLRIVPTFVLLSQFSGSLGNGVP